MNGATTLTVIGGVLAVMALGAGIVVAKYLNLWLQSKTTRAGVDMFDLIGMTFRKVNAAVIVRSKIMAVQAGISDQEGLSTRALEAHYLAGGNVPTVIRSLIAADRADLGLNFRRATAI